MTTPDTPALTEEELDAYELSLKALPDDFVTRRIGLKLCAAARAHIKGGWRDPIAPARAQPGWWTYDDEADAYYFAPTHRAKPPYLTQHEVTAILDIASDGTLAGVELVGELPPPPASADRGEDDGRQLDSNLGDPGNVGSDAVARSNSPGDSVLASQQVSDHLAAKPGGERDRLADAFIGKMHTVDNTGDCVPECWCQQHSPAIPDAGELIKRLHVSAANGYARDARNHGIPWGELGLEAAAALEASQREVERLTVALKAFMSRFADDEGAWDAGPTECWVLARAALERKGT